MALFPSALSRGWRRLLRARPFLPAVVPFVDSQHAYRPAAAIVSDCRCHGIPSSGLCWHAVWGFDDGPPTGVEATMPLQAQNLVAAAEP